MEIMKATQKHHNFIEEAESLLEKLYEVIANVPKKGDKEEDCQYCCLLKRVEALQAAINGTMVDDFIPKEEMEIHLNLLDI